MRLARYTMGDRARRRPLRLMSGSGRFGGSTVPSAIKTDTAAASNASGATKLIKRPRVKDAVGGGVDCMVEKVEQESVW